MVNLSRAALDKHKMIIDGNKIANNILSSLPSLIVYNKPLPKLAVIIVGENPASRIYVEKKRQKCREHNIKTSLYTFGSDIPTSDIYYIIDLLNLDNSVNGILVQLPLPQHLNAQEIIEQIDPRKDVDGLHPYNVGRLATRNPSIRSCTPFGIMKIFEEHEIDVKGMNAVVIGASNIVGRPMALELLLAGATVTICHRFTKDLEQHTSTADIVISAVGKPNVLRSNMIKDGAIVIDVGINRNPVTGKICGDVGDFEQMEAKARFITPVPGGVGPMTVAMLIRNIYQLYEEQSKNP